MFGLQGRRKLCCRFYASILVTKLQKMQQGFSDWDRISIHPKHQGVFSSILQRCQNFLRTAEELNFYHIHQKRIEPSPASDLESMPNPSRKMKSKPSSRLMEVHQILNKWMEIKGDAKKLHYSPQIKLDPIWRSIFVLYSLAQLITMVFITLGDHHFHWPYSFHYKV